ncbi:hypothetical protein FNQ90_14215 [Streptomyces alkaliphilus]|uniref:Uncharacterized protein n=1 Tax=Streptomyces alkaliphilus TaxID=1472722 RepID=A0A7W3TEB3_9ACTN|nr:hypothetical protein [Streptomyces alkaliphilus]MBB0245227.1 hypothetical protein [Streptomyces alkaliphilus]
MRREDSEQFAFWTCRRLFGPIFPYDRCFACEAMHIPPSREDPHNGRYDFAGEGVAVEVVSIVNSSTLRNFSSWNKRNPGPIEGEPAKFGLTLPWMISVPARTPTGQLDTVLEAVRSMERVGMRSTYECSRNRCPAGSGKRTCAFCQVARAVPFDAYVGDEGLVATRQGDVVVLVTENLASHGLSDLMYEISSLLRPSADGQRTDVLRKLDMAERQGKSRRVVCFVPDLYFALRLNVYPNTWKKLGTFRWDAIRPVTDVVVASPNFHRAVVFTDAAPTRQISVRNAKKVPAQRTLGCRSRR